MKKISCLFIFIFFLSCTSNTIFEKPKDLIPRDTMSLLLQEMMIASSAKFIKNKKQQKNINYMPFVYDKFKIDSTRFDISNYYYMSKIDIYQEILENAKNSLESRSGVFNKIRTKIDAIRKDSMDCVKSNQRNLDSIKNLGKVDALEISKKILDTISIRK
jgi:cysteinyl-tRNA synthetase